MEEQTKQTDSTAVDQKEKEVKFFKRAEWCFQFFGTEPVPFAFAGEEDEKKPLFIELFPTEDDVLTFNYKGMFFKIFSREMTEESKQKVKEQQALQQEKLNEAQKTSENESKN